jgi:hypothetical protein
MASKTWFYLSEGRGSGLNPLLASSPLQVLLMKDLVWKILSKLCEKMKVEISSNVKFFRLYPRRRKAKSWGNIGAFRYVRSQSMAEKFLAHDHNA